MKQPGVLNRDVIRQECPWLKRDLPKGMRVYKFNGATYGVIAPNGLAVSDEPDIPPFYEVPADAVSLRDVLVLPQDTTRVAQLEAKLKEYKERLEKQSGEYTKSDTLCKIHVLGSLLGDGRVDLSEVLHRLSEEHGSFSVRSAFHVIQDYCLTGSENTMGGTGLKSASEL